MDERQRVGRNPKSFLADPDRVLYASSWSRDGDYLLLTEWSPSTGFDIGIVDMDGQRQREPFIQSEHAETNPQVSSSGRWLAWESNQSGQSEIVVTPFPERGSRQPVSTNGGRYPVWSRTGDGDELFYSQGDGCDVRRGGGPDPHLRSDHVWRRGCSKTMMSVTIVGPGPEPVISRPELLFNDPYMPGFSVDGQGGFLMIQRSQPLRDLSVARGWSEKVRELAPVR